MIKFYTVCITFSLLIHNIKAQVIPDSLRVDWSAAGYEGSIPQLSLIINVKDFGAFGDSIHDDYNAVVQAMNSASGLRTVYFPAGNYLIKTSIQSADSVVFKGDGTATNLMFNLSSSLNKSAFNLSSVQTAAFVSVNAGFTKGSTKLTVDSVSKFTVGGYAEIQETNGSWDTKPAVWAPDCVGQIVKVTSIKNSQLTISPALRIDYDASLQPIIRPVTLRNNVGIECLKISRIDPATPVNYGYNINFSYAVNCWAIGIESNNSEGSHIMFEDSKNITVSGCYIHDAYGYDGTGTAGYGITMILHTSDCKVENNVMRHVRHSMIIKDGANGNVFGYNYSLDPYRSETPHDYGADMLLHGHYAYANLFEGNVGQTISVDDTWGASGPGNTFFRNRAALYGIIIGNTTVKQNIVGNEVTNTSLFKGSYNLGSGQFAYGNNVKGKTQPAGTSTLPDSSYYLKSIPYFWSTGKTWPSVGYPNTAATGTDPAEDRYTSNQIITDCEKQQYLKLTITKIVSSGSCKNDGSITVKGVNGVKPYKFSIDGIKYVSNNIFSNLSGGNYTVWIKDNAGSKDFLAGIVVNKAAILKSSIIKTNVTCKNANDGTITITAKGGIPPYKYSIDSVNFFSTNTFNNLDAGTYTIWVKDSRLCVTSSDVVIKNSKNICLNFARLVNQNQMHELNIVVSPNPSDKVFKVDITGNNSSLVKIIITDVYGNNVYAVSGYGNQSYRLGENFKPGIYILTIMQDNFIKSFKLIRQ